MPVAKPRVFTIPPSAPFLPVLIDALRDGRLVPGFPRNHDPFELACATLYLPTRRACRLARETFLDKLEGDSAILPRIVPLGDLDEDEIAFAQAATGELALALPDAIAPLERRLLLAELIADWVARIEPARGSPLVANTPTAALLLADGLARLIDDMTTRQIPWDRLDGLVPDQHDKYWQISLEFLKIARNYWPARLSELGAIEAAERRDLLIDAETKRLTLSDAPVIAAGSTGSMPATDKLLTTIARLPHGAVVLPGLDMELDDDSWRQIAGDTDDKNNGGALAASHAQFAMHALLDGLKLARSDVVELAKPAPHGREMLVSEALRPASTTERWQQRRASTEFNATAERALASLTLIEAANAEDEALAIAVALREAEDQGKHAALVTPDRALARRVVAALERWRVPVDDSGGDNLADTSAGRFARLAAEAALNGLEPVTLLALLKHPLLRLGATLNAIAALERAILRGPRPRPGTGGLAHALTGFRANRGQLHRNDPRWLIEEDDLDAASALVARLAAALAPLESLKLGDHSLAAITQCHHDVVTALSEVDGEPAAFVDHDGDMLARALDDLVESSTARGLAVAKSDYTEVFLAAISDRVVRRPETRDVRIRIFGPLEARLQTVQRVVLGSLNEGSWPPEARSDPWLSRPMRRDLGLDPPERLIGLSAHDFAQALGAEEVIFARAAKVAGAPTVGSRFMQRIAALAGEARWQQVCARGQRYLEYARALDHPANVKAAERPQPKPPLAARPKRLSVTEIEHWLRDPYTVYAKHVLRLSPLDAVDTPPGARDRGTVIHDAIGKYTERFTTAPPTDPLKELLALGERAFEPLADYPEARAFWWPRFQRIAEWFVQWDAARRVEIDTLHAEILGELKFPVRDGEFTLRAIADRVERCKNGSYSILDYKTGQPRTEKQVRTGLAPQLTLEAAILRQGGFKQIAPGSIVEIAYVTLKGGAEPGKPYRIAFKEGTPDSQADHALARLKELATRFADEATPYLSLVHPMWKTHYGDYDHLARVKEWSLTGGVDEGEA